MTRTRTGGVLGIYDKLHLTPFDEFHPWRTRGPLGSSVVAEDDYAPGTQWALCEVVGQRFATVICWFGGQPSLVQHLHATLFRAVENRRWLLRATNAGITAVVDPRGAIVTEAPRAETTTLVAAIAPSAPQSGSADTWPTGRRATRVFANVERATTC